MKRIALAVLLSFATGAVGLAVTAAPASAAVLPDLVVTSVTNPPAVARAATVFDVSYTVLNNNQGTAPATISGVFLSTNTTKGASDIFMGGDEVIGLGTGVASSEGPTPMVVPAATPPGRYYLIVCANNVPPRAEEVTRVNNCTASSTRVRIRAARSGGFSGTTAFVFGGGCAFAHQTFTGEFNAFGPFGPGTFALDGCSETTPSPFFFNGTFTFTTSSGTLTGTATGAIGGGVSPDFDFVLESGSTADRITMHGHWTNTGEVPSTNDPINGRMSHDVGDT